jgi:ATP synthase protein I
MHQPETNPVAKPALSRAVGTARSRKASPQRVRQVYQAASASSVGLELGLAVVIGWAIGHWLDGKFGTDPLLMIVFLLLGIAAGFKGVLRVAQQVKRDEAKEQAEAAAAESN